jgi:NADPH-dependent 2,4-dienoyl-CoA reductase/sulfur reductase-like enzyme
VTLAAQFDVVAIGAGPAGMACAATAAEQGRRVALLDDNAGAGGQIWRGLPTGDKTAGHWRARLLASRASLFPNSRVFDISSGSTVRAERDGQALSIRYSSLVLATGARERFLPFPGWTLPNVLGAGGLQAFVKAGLPVRGKRVVVAGTGPLLIAVAAYLREKGARVVALCEQAPLGRLLRFGLGLFRSPSKLAEALRYMRRLGGIPPRAGCWPVAAFGSARLETVRLSDGRRQWDVPCDYLACGFHLVPNLELAELLGASVRNGFVSVDALQRTSVPGVYCAGEPTGIGGLDRSLLEGRIAGLAAAEVEVPKSLHRRHATAQRFAAALARLTALRPELRNLPRPDTLVCRCEDVPWSSLSTHPGWRSAKLQTRCGMGACQGRICGPATAFLFGWTPASVRPPIFPVPLQTLAAPLQSISEDTP